MEIAIYFNFLDNTRADSTKENLEKSIMNQFNLTREEARKVIQTWRKTKDSL